MEKLSDQRLLDQIRTGNHPAFTTLVNRHWEALYRYTCSRIRQEADAVDIVQEIFISCWNNRDTLYTDANDSLSSWLFKAARYCIIDHYSRPHTTIYNEALLEATLHDVADNATTVQLEFKELQQRLEAEIALLPDRLRIPYRMSRDTDLRLREIAEQLSLSEQTVKNNISAALQHLRMRLQHRDALSVLLLAIIMQSHSH